MSFTICCKFCLTFAVYPTHPKWFKICLIMDTTDIINHALKRTFLHALLWHPFPLQPPPHPPPQTKPSRAGRHTNNVRISLFYSNIGLWSIYLENASNCLSLFQLAYKSSYCHQIINWGWPFKNWHLEFVGDWWWG